MSGENIIKEISHYYTGYFCSNLYHIAKKNTNLNIAISYQSVVKEYAKTIFSDKEYKLLSTDFKNIATMENISNIPSVMSTNDKVLGISYVLLTLSGANLNNVKQQDIALMGLKFMADVLTHFCGIVVNQEYVNKIANTRTRKDAEDISALFRMSLNVIQIQFNSRSNMDEDRKNNVANIEIIQKFQVEYRKLHKTHEKLVEENNRNKDEIKFLRTKIEDLQKQLAVGYGAENDVANLEDIEDDITELEMPEPDSDSEPEPENDNEFKKAEEEFEEKQEEAEAKIANLIISKKKNDDDNQSNAPPTEPVYDDGDDEIFSNLED